MGSWDLKLGKLTTWPPRHFYVSDSKIGPVTTAADDNYPKFTFIWLFFFIQCLKFLQIFHTIMDISLYITLDEILF